MGGDEVMAERGKWMRRVENNNKIKLAARLARKANMWEVHITVSFCTRNGIAMWGNCLGGVTP